MLLMEKLLDLISSITFLSKIVDGRKKFLTKVGKKVFRDTTEGEQHVRVTALGGYREVGRSGHFFASLISSL